MNWLQTILMAIVDGLTEIFPVSGDAHTQMIAKLLGISLSRGQFACLRAWMHFGVFLALSMFYRRELSSMLQEQLVILGLRRPVSRKRGVPLERRQLMLWFFSALPMLAGLLLYPLRRRIEQGSFSLLISGLLLGVYGILLFFALRAAAERREDTDLTLADAVTAGGAQILSVLPGVSRCGMSTAVLMLRGMTGETAVGGAGLMGVPVFFAAAITELIAAKGAGLSAAVCILALCVSAIAGFFALRLLRHMARRGSLSVFVYWCWGAGIFCLALFLISA